MMTKRELINLLEAVDVPDETPVVAFDHRTHTTRPVSSVPGRALLWEMGHKDATCFLQINIGRQMVL